MGFYRPGAFKNKDFVEPEKDIHEKVEELLETIKIPEPKPVVNVWTKKKEEIIEPIVKPVEVVENKVWKKFKVDEEKVEEKEEIEEIKPIQYLRQREYLRKKQYKNFLENEWDNLWDMYERMINYDYKFLDKIRDKDDNKGFYDFSRLVFVSLKRYE